MNRHVRPSFQPRLEPLEDRCTPSATVLDAHQLSPVSQPAHDVAAPAAASETEGHATLFRETLRVTSVSDGVYTYEGHANQLGRVTAFSFPDGSFTKITDNGDQIFGQLTPTSATTGSMTFNGGTGRYAHASGSATYVISINPRTGATTIEVVGLLSHNHHDMPGHQHAVPFAITGGGPAPQGLPLLPDVQVGHSATGHASFLGDYTTVDGMFQQESLVISPTGEVTANFQGSITFVAANGDRLVTHYGTGFTGRLTAHVSADGTAVVGVQFDAIFTVDGAHSTGRFAGASGSWRMIAHADSIGLIPDSPFTAPFNYTWTGGGTIVFARGHGHEHEEN
jgi:hypothetical protein